MQNGKRKDLENHQSPLQNRVNKWWTKAAVAAVVVVGREEACRTMEERRGNKETEKER